MDELEKLRKMIDTASAQSDRLSQKPRDMYAKCTEHLLLALECLPQSVTPADQETFHQHEERVRIREEGHRAGPNCHCTSCLENP